MFMHKTHTFLTVLVRICAEIHTHTQLNINLDAQMC